MARSEIKARAGTAALRQLIDISDAIMQMTKHRDELSDVLKAESATWQDVAKFAHVHDTAKEVIERLQIEVDVDPPITRPATTEPM